MKTIWLVFISILMGLRVTANAETYFFVRHGSTVVLI